MSAWIDQVFAAASAENGGIVRRRLDGIEQYASLEELIDEVRGRRFHLILTGDQAVIFCHDGDLRLIC